MVGSLKCKQLIMNQNRSPNDTLNKLYFFGSTGSRKPGQGRQGLKVP